MPRIGAAFFLAAALLLDATRVRYGPVSPDVFMFAGLALLALAVIIPPRPRPAERCHVSETPQHPAVAHPVHLRIRRHRAGMGRIGKVNDWAATHLGVVFGSVWVVWAFFIWPLVAQYMGAKVQVKTSYYAQSWVQLFALPLFVYIGNKLQRSSDAQSEVIHSALTHIAMVSDQNKQLIEQDNALTAQVHALVTALSEQPAPTAQLQSAITLNGPQIKQLAAAIQANASQVVTPPKAAPKTATAKRLATPAERKDKTT